MKPIDGDALLKKFNRKADIMTVLTDEDTANDFAFYCKLADAVEEMPTICGWISVKDRLPEEKENWITRDWQKVICCCDFGGDPRRIDVRTYSFGKGHFWHGPQIMDGVVTHWQYLPEPPKEDDHETD